MNPQTARIVIASTAASNVPEKLEDPQALVNIGRIFTRPSAATTAR